MKAIVLSLVSVLSTHFILANISHATPLTAAQKLVKKEKKEKKERKKPSENNAFKEKEVKASKQLIRQARKEREKVSNAISDAHWKIQSARKLKQRAREVNAKNIIFALNTKIQALRRKINNAEQGQDDLTHKVRRLRELVNDNNAWHKDIPKRRVALQKKYNDFYSRDFSRRIDNKADDLRAVIRRNKRTIERMEVELAQAKNNRKRILYQANDLLLDWENWQLEMKGYLRTLSFLLDRAKVARMNKNINNLQTKIQSSRRAKEQIDNLMDYLKRAMSSLAQTLYTREINYFIPVVEDKYNDLQVEEYAYTRQLKALPSWLAQQDNTIAIREAEIVKELAIAKGKLQKVITKSKALLVEGNFIFSEYTKINTQASSLLDRANKAYVDGSSQRIGDQKRISEEAFQKLTEQTNLLRYFFNNLVIASYPTDVDEQTKQLSGYLPNLNHLQVHLKKQAKYLSQITVKETPLVIKGERILAKAQKLANEVLEKAKTSLFVARDLVAQVHKTILEASSMESRAQKVEKPNIVTNIASFKSKAINVEKKVSNNISKVQEVLNRLLEQKRPENLDHVRLQLSPLLNPLDRLAKITIAPRLALQARLDKYLAVILKREKLSKDRNDLIAKANSWISQLVKTIKSSRALVHTVETKTIPEAKKYFKHINSTKKDINNLKTLSISITEAIARVKPVLQKSRDTIAKYAQASLDEIEVSPTKRNQLSALESVLASEASILNQAYQSLKPTYSKVADHINWRSCIAVENKATSTKIEMEKFFSNYISWNNNGRSDQLANQWMQLYNCKNTSKYQKDVHRLYDFADQNLSYVLSNLKIKNNLAFAVKYVQRFCAQVDMEKLFADALEEEGGACEDEWDDCDAWDDSSSENILAAFKKIQAKVFSCSNLKIVTK
ncbi:MAG: hypothetical protein HAW63_00590 [Bdellovibrionaceae bacterium]|nr:hypothetical protein [Pseudobdellovibrionaceae bacterium]